MFSTFTIIYITSKLSYKYLDPGQYFVSTMIIMGKLIESFQGEILLQS